MYYRKYALVLNKELCKKCRICYWACPKEAIELNKFPKDMEKSASTEREIVDVNPEKCVFCGICEVLCPFGAIKNYVNDQHVIPVVETGSFPGIVRRIQFNLSRCSVCSRHPQWCPLGILRVNVWFLYIEDKSLCPCCKKCEKGCPGCKLCDGVINISKIFEGTVKINQKKCPDGCKDCLDACPVNATYLDQKGKVDVEEKFCVFCGACLNFCPEEDAIEISITDVAHMPTESDAWKKVLWKRFVDRSSLRRAQ